MPKEVWIEWQHKWNTDPWGETRDDLRMGILAQSVYQAVYGAANRVILSFVGGKDEFDYTALPKASDFMPYLRKNLDGATATAEGGGDDGRPLDPNSMTPEQWEMHRLEIDHWNQYIQTRMAHIGATAIGAPR